MIPCRYRFVLAAFLLSVLLYVDRVCISSAKEPITRDLQLSETQFGWVLSAFALGYALLQTPTGWLADRYGPRRLLAAVVTFWSVFTGLTGASFGFAALLVVRFLFGAGEAGAYPGMARATFSWIPMSERGVVQGISFSGARLGAAFALPGVAWLVETLGWRETFLLLMAIGFVWAVAWFLWFRDQPENHPGVSRAELEWILSRRQQTEAAVGGTPLKVGLLLRSANLWLAMTQYFCSNFTNFFCLTWLFPHVKAQYQLNAVQAGLYASLPLVCGAAGNLFSGSVIDRIYRSGRWALSRRLPAVLGFTFAVTGLVGSVQAESVGSTIGWLCLAVFGVDMTISPSWSLCIDIGREHAGTVSGTMNMAGNLGSFVTSLAFPYLQVWTGDPKWFFLVGAGLNLLAIGAWFLVRPELKLEEY